MGPGRGRGFKLYSPKEASFKSRGRSRSGKGYDSEGDQTLMLGKIRSGRERLGSDESNVPQLTGDPRR